MPASGLWLSFRSYQNPACHNVDDALHGYTGIVVPGGFGNRGVEGKILTVKYARENKVPILGVCLGLQVMVIEFARWGQSACVRDRMIMAVIWVLTG